MGCLKLTYRQEPDFRVNYSKKELTLKNSSQKVYRSYLFGYQGSEKDDEVKGEGNSYTTYFRQLDPRLGRWLSIDPLAGKFPWQSPYVSMDNNPINLTDIYGDSTSSNNTPQTHVVSAGETLTSIAKKFNVTVKDLVEWNNIKDPDKIQVGQKLNIFSTNTQISSDNTQTGNSNSTNPHQFTNEQDLLNQISKGQFVLLLSADAISELGGLDAAQKLLSEGKFKAIYNGKTNTWSLEFYGNKTVSAQLVKDAKGSFVTTAARNGKILTCVRAGGVALAIGGAVISTYQYSQGQIGTLEFAADITFTAIGIWGGTPGIIASTCYFGLKIALSSENWPHSNTGGYDLSNQQIQRHPYFVPKR